MILGWEWKVLLVYLRTLLLHTPQPPRPAGILTESDVTFASLTLQAGREYVGVCVCVCVYLFFYCLR